MSGSTEVPIANGQYNLKSFIKKERVEGTFWFSGSRVGSPDSLFDGDDSQSDHSTEGKVDKDNRLSLCLHCKKRFATESDFLDHLAKKHLSKPIVLLRQLSQRTIQQHLGSRKKPPITLKLRKLNNNIYKTDNSSFKGWIDPQKSPKIDWLEELIKNIQTHCTPSDNTFVSRTVFQPAVQILNIGSNVHRISTTGQFGYVQQVVETKDIKVEATEENRSGGGEMRGDEESTMDSGVASPVPPPAPSPTPSEILRPEGYLAPSPNEAPSRCLENGSLSPAMSCISTVSTVAFSRTESGQSREQSPTTQMGRSEEDDDDDEEMDDEDPEDETREEVGNSGANSTVEGQRQPSQQNTQESDNAGWNQQAQQHNQQAQQHNQQAQQHNQQKESISPTIGNITVRPPAELLSPQGLMNNNGASQPQQDGTAEAFSALQGLVSDVQSSDGLKVLSPVDLGLLNGNSGSGDMTNYPCDVCGDVSPSRQSLEIHKTTAGHYRCPVGQDCPLFSSPIDVNSHYQAVHGGGGGGGGNGGPIGGGGPVAQLTQQVQRLQPPPQLPPGVTVVASGGATSSGRYQQQQQQHFKPQQTNGKQEYYGNPTYNTQYQVFQQGSAQSQMGLQVMMTPSGGPPQQLPNLPPGVQLSKRPSSSIVPGVGGKQRRLSSDEAGGGSPSPPSQVRLPDSITLVRPNLSITQQKQQPRTNQPATNGTDPNSVANMLATRGITVVPSSGRSNGAAVSVRRNSSPQANNSSSSATVTSLNSAVSITPSAGQRAGNFAVPSTGRSGRGGGGSPVASLSKLPTVDLTQEMPQPLPPPPQPAHHLQQASPLGGNPGRMVPQPMVAPPPHARNSPMGRPSSRSRVTCQVCDKIFASPEALNVHMHSHRQGAQQGPQGGSPMRSASKLPYECNLCTAQYPTQQGLNSHKQKYHNEAGEGPDLVIPVVDLRQPGTMQRLSGLGIRHFIPLAQLHNQGGGMFGLPIVTVDSARNPAVCNIGGIGASNLFPLGPMKSLR